MIDPSHPHMLGSHRGRVHKWDTPMAPSSLDGLFHGTSQSKMDDDWGYPPFQETSIYPMIFDSMDLFEDRV